MIDRLLTKWLRGRQPGIDERVSSVDDEGTALTESGLLIAGLVLAQAAWKVSDFPEGELLCPFAIVERGEQKVIIPFESASQAAAIEKGKATMAKLRRSADAWAFAREGLIRENGNPVDVLTIDFWAKGMKAPASLIQRYGLQRKAPMGTEGRFSLIGEPVILLGGAAQSTEEAQPWLTTLRHGVHQHPAVASLWSNWT